MAFTIRNRFESLSRAVRFGASAAVVAASAIVVTPAAAGGLAATEAALTQPRLASQDDLQGRETLRDTVRTLIRALGANRADEAFSLTAPSVREKFGDARIFLAVIAKYQTPLYGAKSFAFDGIVRDGEMPVVRTFIETGKNKRWLALFTMEPQSDGLWKILDVAVSAAPGHVI